jgi:CrcB protein
VAALLVLAGGFLGGLARVLLGTLVDRHAGAAFPFGTLVVNVAGSALAGLLVGRGLDGERLADPLIRDLLVVGFCGGFTTVSSFALRTLELALAGQPLRALANVAASTGLSLGAALLGLWSAG